MPVFCLVPMATDIGCDDEATERSSFLSLSTMMT